MKRITFSDRNRSGNLLHIEVPGASVNIRVGLHDTAGRQVTSVEILRDQYAERGGTWALDGQVNNRVIQLRDGETEDDPDRPALAELAETTTMNESTKAGGLTNADLLALAISAAELWERADRADDDDIMSARQIGLLNRAAGMMADWGELDLAEGSAHPENVPVPVSAITALVAYNWDDPFADVPGDDSDEPEDNQRSGHIFESLMEIQQWLNRQ